MVLIKKTSQIPSVFDRFFESEIMDWNNHVFSKFNYTLPSVNIKENEDAFVVEVAAPGFEKSDFKIELNRNVLSIATEKENEETTKDGEFFTKREFNYQSFSRSFTLPQIADSERIDANYNKGILTIGIPKREESKPKPARTIDIT